MKYDPTRAALYYPERRPPLELTRGAWSLDATCAELSRLAYIRFEEGHKAVLRAALDAAGYSGLACFNGGRSGAQAFGCLSPEGRPIVAFRGTQSDKWVDVRKDLRFKLVPWHDGEEVHTGFKEALDSLLDEIQDWLAGQTGKPLLTGHSLGAAMATLLASLIPDAELVTFGSPRCGNAAFSEPFKARAVRRYVDCCDGVTMVPLKSMGYSHVCPPHYIDRFGKVRADVPDDVIDEDRRAARWLYLKHFFWRIGTVWIRELADHAPINYVSALRGMREL
jgi:pimeloyl-ACP methyl ester carboxylesterase